MVVPEEFATCFVEDWIRLDDLAVPGWVDDPMGRLMVTVWRRWKDARRAWAEEVGLTPDERQELLPNSGPRWRDMSSALETRFAVQSRGAAHGA